MVQYEVVLEANQPQEFPYPDGSLPKVWGHGRTPSRPKSPLAFYNVIVGSSQNKVIHGSPGEQHVPSTISRLLMSGGSAEHTHQGHIGFWTRTGGTDNNTRVSGLW
jgi:hypothetical protein